MAEWFKATVLKTVRLIASQVRILSLPPEEKNEVLYMRVLDKPIQKIELKKADFVFPDNFVKGAVDIKKGLLAIDAELHADLEQMLLNNGSDQYDLWGINLYFDDGEDLVEFDSMINIRPAQGNHSRNVEDEKTQNKILDVVNKWVK